MEMLITLKQIGQGKPCSCGTLALNYIIMEVRRLEYGQTANF
jgi:hypothetical protein